MKKIKFRGKNSYVGWVKGQLAINENNGKCYIIQDVEESYSNDLDEDILIPIIWNIVDNETIGEYTGLKDKNGKEIYEGDVVEIKTIEGKVRGEVKYEDKFASYVFVNTRNIIHECENIGDYKKEDIEVIGNIFDNSELLKEE